MTTADEVFAKARAYDETKHKREHGRFSPMNTTGMPAKVDTGGHRYTKVSTDEGMFNQTYDGVHRMNNFVNAYAGSMYGAAGGALATGVGLGRAGVKANNKLVAPALIASALAGGVGGGVGAHKLSDNHYKKQKTRDKYQSKFDRRDLYAREAVGKLYSEERAATPTEIAGAKAQTKGLKAVAHPFRALGNRREKNWTTDANDDGYKATVRGKDSFSATGLPVKRLNKPGTGQLL